MRLLSLSVGVGFSPGQRAAHEAQHQQRGQHHALAHAPRVAGAGLRGDRAARAGGRDLGGVAGGAGWGRRVARVVGVLIARARPRATQGRSVAKLPFGWVSKTPLVMLWGSSGVCRAWSLDQCGRGSPGPEGRRVPVGGTCLVCADALAPKLVGMAALHRATSARLGHLLKKSVSLTELNPSSQTRWQGPAGLLRRNRQ